MRLKKRINIFIENMDLIKILECYFPHQSEATIQSLHDEITSHLDMLIKTWRENADWRFSQLLVNTGMVPNVPGMWYYMEDEDVLIKTGNQARDVLLWGRNYDKDMNQLPKTEWMLIKDMSADHIKAILKGKFTGHPVYLKAFKEELELRSHTDKDEEQ